MSDATPSSTGERERGRLGRILHYLRRMAPPVLMVPAGAGNFLVIYFGLQAFYHPGALSLTVRSFAGMATVILFAVLMRVYDEMKDAETDLRLARAGDPRYADRPIVTGEIIVADLSILRWVLTALLVAANAPLGFPLPLAGFVAAFFLTWLSFKWFFYPRMKDNLLLAFATHNPLTLVIAGYVGCVYVADFGPDGLDARAAVLLLGVWLPFAAWETSRKVRVPEAETEYQTYSMILGWRIAALVPAVLVAGSLACFWHVARGMGLEWYHLAVIAAGAALPLYACLRFLFAPTPPRSKLRPFVEAYMTVVNIGLPVMLVTARGVGLR